MRTFERTSALFFMCLGVMLAFASILVVPTEAFADYTGQCSACQLAGDPASCGIGCCNTYADPDSANQCCSDACNGNSGCISTCLAGLDCKVGQVVCIGYEMESTCVNKKGCFRQGCDCLWESVGKKCYCKAN